MNHAHCVMSHVPLQPLQLCRWACSCFLDERLGQPLPSCSCTHACFRAQFTFVRASISRVNSSTRSSQQLQLQVKSKSRTRVCGAMFFTSALQVVFKTTGGRIWNKRWGLPRLTRTRKENRKKDIKLFNQNIDVLKAAAHLQPEVPVQLHKPLPQWQVDRMRRRLESAQEELNIRASGPIVAQQLLRQRQRPQQQQQQLAGPPVDPQLQQRLNQQEVTRIKQQQARRFLREQQQQQKEQQSSQGSQQQQQ